MVIVVIGAFLLGMYSGWEWHRFYLRKLWKLSVHIRKKFHGG